MSKYVNQQITNNAKRFINKMCFPDCLCTIDYNHTNMLYYKFILTPGELIMISIIKTIEPKTLFNY